MAEQAERQRRWYLGLTEEQRDARREYQRVAHREKYANDPEFRWRKHDRNATRMFAGGMYLGTLRFTDAEVAAILDRDGVADLAE